MIIFNKIKLFLVISLSIFLLNSCGFGDKPEPRLSLFIGVDISGSFIKGPYFNDSINFLAHYIYAHLNGLGGLEVPSVMFVGSIGGAKKNEPKTFHFMQQFENKSIEEIKAELKIIFPKNVSNPFTDFNAFFEQIAMTVQERNLILKPISIVMISDGIPDVKNEVTQKPDFRSLNFKPLELLSRNITVRLLYTDAVVGRSWKTDIPRKRVKVWTQDATAMVSWKDASTLDPNKPFEEQDRFFRWIKDQVDFGVRSQRIN
ncbi:MAG: hypothetical protein JXR46_05690 [Calditrichaceae bacterium]|nr:hypothetical protein [Calditrichaceae bacterium]MBN2708519.1 hypothetical protein [Calditrichaceae bacterium]RQV95436.1 MAG: hypothetical protein EH224_07395 [Calditrichota bacterium]